MQDPFTNNFKQNQHQNSPFEDNFTSFDQFVSKPKMKQNFGGFKSMNKQESEFQNFDFDKGKFFETLNQIDAFGKNTSQNFPSDSFPRNEPQSTNYFAQAKENKIQTPFDEQFEDANNAKDFGLEENKKGFSFNQKKEFNQTKITSDQFQDPFDEEGDSEVKLKNVTQKKTGLWGGLISWNKKEQPKDVGEIKFDVNSGNKALDENDQFDMELEKQKKGIGYIPRPFDIKVEDKIESSYEFLGRKVKEGVKKIKKIDKKIQNWAHGKNKEDQFLEREDEIKAEAVSNSINTFIGGNIKLNPISIDVNKRSKINVEEIANKIRNDKPIKFKIKTKKDFMEQKKKEEIMNPFEEANDFDNTDFEFENQNKSLPKPQDNQINTPFLDEFMSESDSKNIFGTSSITSKPVKSKVTIFGNDDEDDAQIFGSNTFQKNNFNNSKQNSQINRIMGNDFLNFGQTEQKKREKDPFESVFD